MRAAFKVLGNNFKGQTHMRQLILIACISYIITSPLYADSAAEQDYFPQKISNIFIKQNGSDILINEYANQLAKLNEKSIYKQCQRDGSEIYRFLYSPALDQPFAVTIRRDDNKFLATYAFQKADANDNDMSLLELGKLCLEKRDWEGLKKIIELTKFFELPTTTEQRGTDGATWVFEGCRSGQYQFLSRWMPEPNGEGELLLQLGDKFIDLADLNKNIRPVIVNPRKQP